MATEPTDAVAAGIRKGFKLTLAKERPESAPLVVLLGWYGCQDKYLAKYSEAVNALGLSTLRTIVPMADFFHPLDAPRVRWARGILDFLLEAGLCPQRRLVFYSFSNGGCMIYSMIYKLLQTEEKYKQLKGTVAGAAFDSCPAFLMYSGMAGAMAEPLPAPLRPLMWVVAAVLVGIYFVTRGNYPAQFWHEMEQFDLGVPHLYLYSADDKLTVASYIDELVKIKADSGTEVYAKRWDSSPHVGHLRAHPQEYTAELKAFFGKCFPASIIIKADAKAVES